MYVYIVIGNKIKYQYIFQLVILTLDVIKAMLFRESLKDVYNVI